jgi:hypothetical protein
MQNQTKYADIFMAVFAMALDGADMFQKLFPGICLVQS